MVFLNSFISLRPKQSFELSRVLAVLIEGPRLVRPRFHPGSVYYRDLQYLVIGASKALRKIKKKRHFCISAKRYCDSWLQVPYDPR